MAGAACIAPAVAAPERIPPLVEPRGQEHHVGKVIFEELVTPDLAASKLFYAGMFGWSFQDLQADGTRYATASLDGRPVAGLVQKDTPADGHRHPAWLTFVAVRDVDATRETAVRNGARVLLEPRNIPDRGREAKWRATLVPGQIENIDAVEYGDLEQLVAENGGFGADLVELPYLVEGAQESPTQFDSPATERISEVTSLDQSALFEGDTEVGCRGLCYAERSSNLAEPHRQALGFG